MYARRGICLFFLILNRKLAKIGKRGTGSYRLDHGESIGIGAMLLRRFVSKLCGFSRAESRKSDLVYRFSA